MYLARVVAQGAGVGLGTCVVVLGELYSPESPPVISSVPLNGTGAPTQEYDIVAVFLEGCRSTKNMYWALSTRGEEGQLHGRGLWREMRRDYNSWNSASNIRLHQGEIGSPTVDYGRCAGTFMGGN
jgi:hypothetical protein